MNDEIQENAGVVFLEEEFLNGDLLKVSVQMENVKETVLGTAFHLKYDEKLDFLRYEPGDFLENGGDPFYLVKNDEGVRNIVFGQTLRRNDEYPTGGGKLVDFYFQIREEGEFGFDFDHGVVSTWDTVRQDLLKIEWQNLSFERPQEKKIVLNSQEQVANIFESKLPTDNIYWWLPGILILVMIFFMLKKERKKRA